MELKSEILVSVLVAAYNMENLLERCIDSLLNQTLKNIEIILVDDGSTDNTGIICDKYASLDCRVKVIHQKNMGLSLARKAGLKVAKGSYIRFIDSDDWCELNMCEKLFEGATDSGADIVFCSAYRHRDDGIANICNLPLPNGIYDVNNIYDDYILPLYGDLKADRLVTTGYVWCCLFKREILNNIEFIPEICLHEDEILVIQALINSSRIYITDDVLYHYNRMGTNTMSKKSCYWDGYWENMVAVFLAKKKFGEKLFINETEYMYRLVTTLYLKFFRSIRNETHYLNRKKFWGGLAHLYRLPEKKYMRVYRKYLLRSELTNSENLMASFVELHIYYIPYFYYAIKCNRMRNFQEKTKN